MGSCSAVVDGVLIIGKGVRGQHSEWSRTLSGVNLIIDKAGVTPNETDSTLNATNTTLNEANHDTYT